MIDIIELSKSDITNKIIQDNNFQMILNCFKTDITNAFKIKFIDDFKNGLGEQIFCITCEDKIIQILVPVFSSERTTTWNFSYNTKIKEVLPVEYQNLSEGDLTDLIMCPIYYFDKYTGDIQFLTLVKLSDWLNNGLKGKNNVSVYYWNDKLPNNNGITKSKLKDHILVNTLPYMNDKQLKDLTLSYAVKYHSKFSNTSNRSDQTIIKNIANGLYAQIKVYLYLLNSGYDVNMNWSDGDDLGIDITYNVNNVTLNIDVKSTKTDDLKISKNRKETDFYAICKWDKSNVILMGYLFKYDFWKSNFTDTIEPTKKDDMYFKSLDSLKDKIIENIEDVFTVYRSYQLKKMKKGERLFNEE